MDKAEARDAICKLIYGYAEALDSGDLDRVAALFEHAVMRAEGAPGEFRGAEEVKRSYAAYTIFYDDAGEAEPLAPGSRPWTKHMTSNVMIDFDESGTAAAARSYFVVFQSRPDFPLQAVAAGSYRDRFELVDGRWRFTERIHILEHLGDVSRHLNFAPPGG